MTTRSTHVANADNASHVAAGSATLGVALANTNTNTNAGTSTTTNAAAVTTPVATVATEKIPYVSAMALHELTTRFAVQLSAADLEIDETRAILKDAIDRLMPAFVVSTMRAGDTTEAVAGRRALSQSHTGAFSALQFQDISDQQLAHAQERLRALRVQLLRLQSALDTPARSTEGTTPVTLLQLVNDANDELATLDLSLEKPVSSPHLGTGDMEMF